MTTSPVDRQVLPESGRDGPFTKAARLTDTAGAVTVEPVDHLDRYWRREGSSLSWDCPFTLPPWLGPWQALLAGDLDAALHVMRSRGVVIGLAPVTVKGDGVFLIGDPDLIDFSDFVIAPSREEAFFALFFGQLRSRGVTRLTAERVRADSPAVSFLRARSASLQCDVACRAVDVLYEIDLPGTWEAYLELLPGKERHETRRKLRRLEDAGAGDFHVVENLSDLPAAMDTFITLFRSNRPEKAQFMTGRVEAFFRAFAAGMAEAGLLRLFALDLNGAPAAMAMCFDHNSTVYLYNNGFDRRFSRLSVGLLSKVFSIKDSILRGRKKYNFLRGAEPYKRRLGGRPVTLLRVEVHLR